MADTTRLDETHRLAQVRVRDAALIDLSRLWEQVIAPERFDATHPALTGPVLTLLARYRPTSAGLAAQYYRQVRAAAGITSTLDFVLPVRVEPDRVATSLTVTGPVARSRALRQGAEVTDAVARARTATLGAVGRLVLDAGRATTAAAMAAEPDVRPRWRRVTSADPCEFCRMLAGRGAVYLDDTAGFQAHDHCGCTPAPQF